MVADQGAAESSLHDNLKDDVYRAYAVAGRAAVADKNREDPEMFARLGWGGDGAGESAARPNQHTPTPATRGVSRARAQTSSTAAALVKATEAARNVSFSNITAKRQNLKTFAAAVALEKKANAAAEALASTM